MVWTTFWDMNSGGGQKEKWKMIYIEAPEEQAKLIFYNRFGHNPERVTCTCCGEDYSISEEETLAQASAFHRHLRAVQQKRGKDGRYKPLPEGINYYLEPGEMPPKGYEVSDMPTFGEREWTLEEYVEKDSVLIIRREEIDPEDREGVVPEQGYVWKG